MFRNKYLTFLLTFVFFTSALFGNASFASAYEAGVYYTGEHDDQDAELVNHYFDIYWGWDVDYMTSHVDDITASDLYEADFNDFVYISGHGWKDPCRIPIYENNFWGFDYDEPLYVLEDDAEHDDGNENNFIVYDDEWERYLYETNTRWGNDEEDGNSVEDLEWAVLAACSQLSYDYGNYKDWALAMCGEARMHSIWGYPNTAPSGSKDYDVMLDFVLDLQDGESIYKSWENANIDNEWYEWAGVYHTANKWDCLWGFGDVEPDTDKNDEVNINYRWYGGFNNVYPASVQTSSKVLKNQYSEINVKTAIPEYPEELKPLLVKNEKLPDNQLAKDYAKMNVAKADFKIRHDGARSYRDGSKLFEIYDSGAIRYHTVSEAVYGELSKDPDDEQISEAGDDGSISENCNDNESVSSQVYDDEEISFDKEEAIAQAREFISSIGGMPSDALAEPEIFVEKEVELNFDGGQENERIVEYGIVFRHDYDLPIRGQGDYIRVSINNNGVDSFFKHWSEPIGLAKKSQSIVPPETILEEIEKNVHKYVKLDQSVDITNMQLVYYSQYRNKKQTTLYPAWEIEFDRGYKIYVDAFTGKIID
ncbi:YycH protein [Desulfotomaculum arcticum]|uniref:YycH protein n=1 Tax=Desulfotruncus arcticus DSM 17038 TaxID=1121424 RepID=A0A1I2WEK4_9FIRM|nr:hypothetical protein [Desulfotruncus arcticus]SFG98041.1 YycH protein [Desulfotomaculum arcticum] [Desulfotruncus arcticus DSM 17038]